MGISNVAVTEHLDANSNTDGNESGNAESYIRQLDHQIINVFTNCHDVSIISHELMTTENKECTKSMIVYIQI